MEASLIFTPSSFIPRSAMANLTIHTMGRAVNALEFGIRLENAEDLLKTMLGHHSSTLNEILVGKDKEDKLFSPEPPAETVTAPNNRKPTSKKYNPGEQIDKKSDQQKAKKSKHSCPSGKYNKLTELQQKFTQGMHSKKELRCGLSMKVFGNELIFLDCEGVRDTVRQYYLSLAGLAVKLLKGQEVQYNRRFSLAADSIIFPVISGFPVQLALNASASTNIKIRGNMDFRQQTNFFLNGYIKPSASLQLSAQMGITGIVGKIGLTWVTGIRTMSSLDGGIQMKRGQDLKIFLNTPEDSMEILDFSSHLYFMTPDGFEKMKSPIGQIERKSCVNEEVSKLLGWQPCLEVSFPDGDNVLPFPLSGPAKALLRLRKHDKGLQQYLLEASYNHVSQKDSWLPNEATLHFFMGTPKSDFKRDVGIDLYYNINHRKFRLKLLHPKNKFQMDGKMESSRNSRNGHLELIVDDKIYYIKGMTDLQTVGGEQRYSGVAEWKLSKHGGPIILSGNVTKQHGKKMALSLSLNNLLKDAAFITVLIDKKADDKLKQYSLEGEAYVPGVIGSYAIGLLQQRGSVWSNAMRVKYGLLGDAKILRHECDTRQKIKIDTESEDQYRVDFEHEFYCTQIQALNHKVHLHHEEYAPHIHSYLEVSYGKHWDEMNNKKKLFISQTFKNNSNPSASSYFMEFTLQVSEKQVNYRTQLLHTHSALESNTNFKVQYNDRMPFVAGLQWKDTSKNDLQKWEGAFTMDTPWLYLYSALKLHQPQRHAYQTIVEVSAGKALSVKNLVLEMFHKDTGSEKEGRIHIHTPTVTYLRASSVNFIGGNSFRSYSEMVSLWNQLIKNEIHLENNEKIKILSFKIKSAKQEFNVTADYWITDLPKKSNFLLKTVWVDQKSIPLVIQLNGQIEDVKKEIMFYQKRGLIHFRHPFKFPIPQSVLLQETFTVDKRKRHYILETKLVLDQKDECVQTIILGYQADNPYICAGLKHPLKHKSFPSNIEACASTKKHLSGKHEADATIKVNKKDIFSLTGKFENKSKKNELWQAVRMDMTHVFQVRFPRALSFHGEIFSRGNKQNGFDHSVHGKVIINTESIIQLHVQFNRSVNQMWFYSHLTHPYQWKIPHNVKIQASGKRYGSNNTNGTFIIHYSGKDMVLMEIDVNQESRKNIRTIGLSMSMQQALTDDLQSACIRVIGKVLPSRVSLTSRFNFMDKFLLIDLSGSKEQKVGLVLSVAGNLVHNIDRLAIIPHQFSADGSLKQKKNINEGYISLVKNKDFYQIHLRNRNVFGNGSHHNITLSFTQNGSHGLPAETKLRANVQLEELHKNGQVCIQVDTKLLCVDLSNSAEQENGVKGILSHNIVSLQSAGIPMQTALEAAFNNTSNNKTWAIALSMGSSSIDVSIGMEKTSVNSQLAMSMKHNVENLNYHGVPYVINAVCYHQSSKFLTGIKISVEGEDIKVEVQKKTAGSASDISLILHNDLSSINNIMPSSIKVICNGEFTSNLFYGHCYGEVARKNIELSGPVKAIFNGSLLTTGYKTNVFGLASSGDAFVRLNINTEWGLHNSIEIGFKHALPELQNLGMAKDNKIRITAIRQGKNAALLDITAGKCVFKASCEARMESNGSAASTLNWTSSVLNTCSLLEKLQFPKNLTMNGSLQRHHCDIGFSMRVDNKGREVKLQLKTTCDPYTMEGTLNHSVSYLTTLGLPPTNHIVFSALTGSSVGGLVSFHSGHCRVNAEAVIKPSNKTEWTLQSETDCKLLKDLNVPSQTRINGSAVINGCEAQLLCALTLDGNTSELQMRTECQPKIKVEFVFRHNLPMLKEINEESKLSISVGKQINYNVEIVLKLGTCAIEVRGDINADNKLQWKMVAENKCKTIQDLGAPIKIEGSGYVVINKKANLDSQMLVVVDESTLQGLLILKATEKKQELDAVLTHNVQPAINLGIPIRTMVDVTIEKSSDLYRRTIRLGLDSKQITEEVSFMQKLEGVSLSYKITHNLETLKKMLMEDNMEIRAVAELQEARNMSIVVYYGPNFINTTMRVKGNETNTNLAASVQHNWAWLLRNGIAASLQTSLDVQALNGKQELSLEAATAQNSFVCRVSSLCTGNSNRLLFRSAHNIESFLKHGYPKVVRMMGTLSKEGETVNGTLDLESDKKKLNVDLRAYKGVGDMFGITARVKHSIPMFFAWTIPNSTQVLFQVILSNADIGGAFKLTCDQGTSIFITANVKSRQQGEELIMKATHSVSTLQRFFPSSSAFITGVTYSTSEAEAKLYLMMEEKELNLSTRINFTEPTYAKVLRLKHSFPQLKNLPALIEMRTIFEKRHKTFALHHITVWGRKDLKLAGYYTGQFPKLSGVHEITGEFAQSLVLSALRQANVSINIEHSTYNHQDYFIIGWSNKNQVNISSALKIGEERLFSRYSISHPFSFAVRELELCSLSEWKDSQYNQKTHLAWNKGNPINFTVLLEDNVINSSGVWNACVTVLPGQIQHIMGVRNLQVCGSMEKTSNLFLENVDVRWDDKKIVQSLLYKRDSTPNPSSLQLEATFENIFVVGCRKQHFLTKIDTNYMDTLNHILKLEVCDLPHPIVFSGSHHLGKEELLHSKISFSISPYENHDTIYALILNVYGEKQDQNYSLNLKMKASDDVHLWITGKYVWSPDIKQILLEGRFDDNDMWTLSASSAQRCLQLNLGQHVQGSSAEKAVVLNACMDPNYLASVDTYVNVNRTLERLGHFILSTANQSLSLSYQGCGENIAKAENVLGSLASNFKTRFMEMNKKINTYIGEIQKTVQQYSFLHEAIEWPLAVSQDIVETLQYGPKAFHQAWKQSGLRQTLRHDLPLYLEKLNHLVQQMQTELQKPLSTLKDAYYDATLEPLDDVWREKTEACLHQINVYLPSIIKDDWLMEPIRHLLYGIKSGLDMGIQQLLKWTENKLSRAVSRIRKPLTGLFSYSSNCSVTLNFPVLPMDYRLTDLANVTHYIIEEKLMKSLRDLYSINLVAEYYRFKHRMMESPFEYHAVLIGNKHIITFDGNIVDLSSKCSLLLAKDFVHNTFTMILNQGTGGQRSLHVEMNRIAIDIYPGLKIEENCQSLDLPTVKNGVSVKKNSNKIEVSNQEGATVICDVHHDVCSFTLDGWHHGVSAGLFGTNDNEARNDFLLPDHTCANTTQDFSLKWQVDSPCSSGRKKMKACPIAPHQKLCKALFQGAHSVLRNCFKVVHPAPFYSMCVEDICDSNHIKPICNLAAAYVHLCNRNLVPIEIPSQCV
ncbi:uncharacterized protein LOC134945174 [Pseudophryne corroboree]|uniref:uncharacterized protein LOC134945174 n=1 Tax=Pseudophryne corroboree TaxID=495146 RepID=UPI003081B35A